MATFQKRPVEVEVRRAEAGETIRTREGTLTAEEGDLIITGVEGEVYPIAPEILAKTYLPRDEEARTLYEEILPEGVQMRFGHAPREGGGQSVHVEGIYVVPEGLSSSDREAAEAFVREWRASSSHLDSPGTPEA